MRYLPVDNCLVNIGFPVFERYSKEKELKNEWKNQLFNFGMNGFMPELKTRRAGLSKIDILCDRFEN